MLKKGKEEIIYLLNKAIEKYQLEQGKELVRNTNKKNYESFAIMLSEISNQLPQTAEKLGHQSYETDSLNNEQNYPFRKYDITGGQIRDALMGLVASPRSFLVDTCYIYLYEMGRQAFERNPVDDNLLSKENEEISVNSLSLIQENQQLKLNISELSKNIKNTKQLSQKRTKLLLSMLVLVLALFTIFFFQTIRNNQQTLKELRSAFNILPYQTTQMEIATLEGIWICYTGSPQARLSDEERNRKVVANLVEMNFKDGYFTYNRFGANFNHVGYAQFESPNVVSIHSMVQNKTGKVESPRHSLLTLDSQKQFINAISASWNFDIGEKNKIIGIREVYRKIGKGGKLEEVLNSLENASCKCKIIIWTDSSGKSNKFYIKNMLLDSLNNKELESRLDRTSILLKDPDDSLLIQR